MNKAAGKKKKPRKPVRRAEHWGGRVLPMAGKLLMIMVAVVVLGVLFSALQTVGIAWLRYLLSLLIAAGMLAVCFSEGMNKGAGDAAESRFYERMSREGRAMTREDDASCFHPLKALCAALIVFSVPLLMAAYLAATAQDYTYALQDLPTWLTQTYGTRADVMGPLGAYAQTAGLEVVDWVRMFVRMTELIFVNLFPDPQTMSATIDRLSPAFIALYPAAYVIGYLCGPAVNDKRERMNRRAKKVAVRRASKSNLVDELLGTQNQVHYGHRADSESHKKKELV